MSESHPSGVPPRTTGQLKRIAIHVVAALAIVAVVALVLLVHVRLSDGTGASSAPSHRIAGDIVFFAISAAIVTVITDIGVLAWFRRLGDA